MGSSTIFLHRDQVITININFVAPERPRRFADFGAYLKDIRQQSNKTWGQVLRDVEIDHATLSRDERGITDIPPARLLKYADVYRRPREEVISRWVKVRYGVDLAKARKISAADIYPSNQVAPHDWLQWVLERGTEVQRAAIISSLKAYVAEIYVATGLVPMGFELSKKERAVNE